MSIPQQQFETLLAQFGFGIFSTYDFISHLKRDFPATWKAIVEEYGEGGKGAQTHYSAFSRVAHVLDANAKQGLLYKLDYGSSKSVPNWGSPVIRYWTKDREKVEINQFPNEVAPGPDIYEGALTTVQVNRYERDPQARQLCIEHHGATCAVCDFDFGEVYGERGAGFIHVHHVVPLSQVGGSTKIDPINDLVPVCPNCHSMLHKFNDGMTVEKLRGLIGK